MSICTPLTIEVPVVLSPQHGGERRRVYITEPGDWAALVRHRMSTVRQASGVTCSQLAMWMGKKSGASISQFETGVMTGGSWFHFAAYLYLARRIGVSPAWMFGFSDDPHGSAVAPRAGVPAVAEGRYAAPASAGDRRIA